MQPPWLWEIFHSVVQSTGTLFGTLQVPSSNLKSILVFVTMLAHPITLSCCWWTINITTSCNKATNSLYVCMSLLPSLQSHRRQHNKDKPYKCHNCNRGYTDAASLEVHLSTHTVKHAKLFSCGLCNRSYTSVGCHTCQSLISQIIHWTRITRHRTRIT